MIVIAVNWQRIAAFLLLLSTLLAYCEFIIYYVVLLQCSWPQLDPNKLDFTIRTDQQKPLKVMLFADPHLLGTRLGHWFDKLRREWQMERSFQTSMTIHSPDVVFVLGDVFDEGKWSNDVDFQNYFKQFNRMFRHSSHTDTYVVVGNHDIGFHYMIDVDKRKRFSSAFQAPSVRMVRIRDNIFVLVNSMAFEGDHCDMCQEAEQQLETITQQLHRAKGTDTDCASENKFKYTKPILLQHFPLYRPSDKNCSGHDGPPPHLKDAKFKEKYDCLSKQATQKLLNSINPRFVVSGHTHHGCHTIHKDGIPEWTMASFSWRNRPNPTFMLATISNNNYTVKTCFLPTESVVISTYVIGVIVITIWFIFPRCRDFLQRTKSRKSSL